jgi:hypothetical protein
MHEEHNDQVQLCDITEILLKVALNYHTPTNQPPTNQPPTNYHKEEHKKRFDPITVT